MPQMNRNVNLEEIDSDALFGIDALKNQTVLQKIIFFGSILAGMAVNVCLPLFWKVPRIVCVAIFMGLLLVGIAFGCNYTEDMTYGKYLYYFFFKPSKYLLYESTEDVKRMKKKAEEIKKEEELKLQRQKAADPKAQKKLLIKLVAFVLAVLVVIISVFTYVGTRDDGIKHHTIEVKEEVDGNKQKRLCGTGESLSRRFLHKAEYRFAYKFK